MLEKVAIINSVYEYGSTGALAKQLYHYGRKHGYEAFVFYGRGDKSSDDHVIKIDSNIEVYTHKFLTLLTGFQGKYSNHATEYLIGKIKEENIRKVILLNLHGYYLNELKLLTFLKESKIRTAYVTPDEYAGLGKCCYSGNCLQFMTECKKCPKVKEYPKSLLFDRSRDIFKMKWKAYNDFDTMTLIGPEANLSKFRNSALTRHLPMKCVSWGVDLDLYKFEIDDTLFERYNIPRDKVIVLTVASYKNLRKGVKEFFFEVAKRLEGTDYHFINVGYDGDLKLDKIPQNVTIISYLDDQKELAHLYAMSDLYLLASTADTMPISCLISFACETPVCCFYTSGLRYLANRSNPAIRFCDEVSVDALEQIIRDTRKKDKTSMSACRELAEEEYSIDTFDRKVYETIEG